MNKYLRKILAGIFLISCGGVLCGAPAFQREKGEYVIVLSKEASPSEKWAAEELSEHLSQMTTKAYPVTVENGALPEKAIIIGEGLSTRTLGVTADFKKLGNDGFILKTVGTHLVIIGGRKRGTMYGVYELLEKLGCRWWTPSESTIPKMNRLEIPKMDITQIPKLEYRDMMYGESFSAETRLWYARNKVNGMAWEDAEGMEKFGGRYLVSGNLVHSYVELLKASGDELKPEMWALKVGKRMIERQPCLSNPNVFAAIVKSVVRKYKEKPELEFVVVGQNDNSDYCTCENCAALDKAAESHAGQVITFANKVAEEVEKQVPGAKISTAAYEWSRKPPKNIKPRENVIIVLCTIECDFAHPIATAVNPENKQFKEDIEGWGKIAKKLLIWHYSGNRDHYLMPNPELDALVPNVKFLADNSAVGIFVQGTHAGRGTDFSEYKMWAWSKALWNPEVENSALLKEFCDGYYEKAAGPVMRYLDIIHSFGRKNDYHLGRRAVLSAPFLAPEIICEAEKVLREADKLAAGNPTLERRVRHAHMAIRYVIAKRSPSGRLWTMLAEKPGKPELSDLSNNLALTVKEFKIDKVNDPDEIEPFLAWLKDYAALFTAKGVPVPFELKGVAPNTYSLIQAGQMDKRSKWWEKMAGATDGWVCAVPGYGGWVIGHSFGKNEEIVPGKKYKVFVRVKGLEKSTEGFAFQCGFYFGKISKNSISNKIKASELADGEFHAIEIGSVTFPADGTPGSFWFDLPRGGSLTKVFFDCMWLIEEKK